MATLEEINEYAENPSLLADLCRQVIESLASPSIDEEARATQAQLREIDKAIRRLDRTGIPIPEGLRAEKTRLVSKLAAGSAGLVALNRLAEELGRVLQDLNTRIGRNDHLLRGEKPRRRRSRLPRTDKRVLREQILLALKKLGGSARTSEVLDEVGKQLESEFLAGDLEWNDSHSEHTWRSRGRLYGSLLAKEGVLRPDSPHGIWELSEDHL